MAPIVSQKKPVVKMTPAQLQKQALDSYKVAALQKENRAIHKKYIGQIVKKDSEIAALKTALAKSKKQTVTIVVDRFDEKL